MTTPTGSYKLITNNIMFYTHVMAHNTSHTILAKRIISSVCSRDHGGRWLIVFNGNNIFDLIESFGVIKCQYG